ncbi:unnamed protein product [Rhizoctonia solani]|uniref:Uncharacterized protein n=1 Tax=Rhizoctonia solani TaxID=456999 RepID=A0A8H3DQ82_9AGAM|nr:unnamed protein product [Rhizoctonia solani]
MAELRPGRYRLEIRSTRDPNRVDNKYATAKAPDQPVRVERESGNIQNQAWIVIPGPEPQVFIIKASGMNTDWTAWHNKEDGLVILGQEKLFKVRPYSQDGPIQVNFVQPLDHPIMPGGDYLVGTEGDIVKANRYPLDPEVDRPVWAFIPLLME